ncbi:MAG: hypothetical protein CML55_04775 [Rhodobacteraceae bacterium]|nr:hypothetical protein [Paracoccaceae bacterium]MBO28453.1 hypothetical protein [Paracoccaceae bacterium]
MRLNLTQTDKIEALLSKFNGSATSFTITEASTLRAFAVRAEKQLAEILPKSAWEGARAACRPAGPSASSYKLGAKSNECTLERGSTGWFLVACNPVRVYPKSPSRCAVSLTAAQTIAAPLYAKRRLKARFGLDELAETASAHERMGLAAEARKLIGIS